ncbi:unnamed protein product [Allacma fusca]|uniref:Uncharacterized protein n=1 Tax=Allacma fusca TaxID=39272 RepID=A0A8J2MGU2_9HEXA|nr:unnamed protein product [Allacma fusca]
MLLIILLMPPAVLVDGKGYLYVITFYLLFLSFLFGDFLLRWSTIYYSKEILNIWQSLLKVEGLRNFKYSGRMKLYFVLTALVFGQMAENIFTVIQSDYNIDESLIVPERLKYLRWLHKSFCIASDTLTSIFLIYAILFVSLIGIASISWYEVCLKKLVKIVERTGTLKQDFKATIILAGTLELKIFAEEFTRVKQCLEDYCKIAGNYALILVLNCTISLTIFFSDKMAGRQSNPSSSYYLGCIGLILLIASLGNFMTNTVQEMQEKLSNTAAVLLLSLDTNLGHILQWVLRWRWKMSAFDLFDINYGVILQIIGVMLTYLVFFFQLKILEDPLSTRLESKNVSCACV